MRTPIVLLVTLTGVLAACSPVPPPISAPPASPLVSPRCPEAPFDTSVPLGPEFAQDVFLRDESKVIATDFLVGLSAIYADPATADICAQFTEQGWREALAFDPRLRAVERGESIVTQDHVLMIAFESTYDLRERPPVVPLDIVFDIPAGSQVKDVSSGETRTSTSDAREGFHADFMFDGHRWRVDGFGPIGADYRDWAVMPATPPAGPPCTGFERDPRGAPFDDDATRRWCDADGRGRWMQQTQLVLSTRYPCDTGTAAILTIGRPLGASPDPLMRWEYVRDPAGEFLAQQWLTAPYDGDVTMPEDAAYSGWTNGNIELWISPSDLDRAVYLVRGDTAERWPRAAADWGVTDCN
jgi:hypothetical protein